MACPSKTIFSPLYSGGLWLPVTIMPFPVPNSCVEKYNAGDVTCPIFITSTPVEVIPSISAVTIEGPLNLPSLPTQIDLPFLTELPIALPINFTPSIVKEFPTMPRIS